jgi:outer membrane protein assembly factor BamB
MRTSLSAALAVVLAASLGAADHWPGFRGPTGDGTSTAKSPPTKWGEGDNVAWKAAVHGKGWSSPVVLGDQVWVTTADEVTEPEPKVKKGESKKGGPPPHAVKEVHLFAVGLDRATGKVRHDLKLATIPKPQYCHPFNSYASSTPFIEEGRLYAHFGALGTFCVDTATGKTLWERLDFQCDHFRGPGSSVAVYGDLVYLIFDGADLQYVAALDKKTGETKWKADRKIKYGPGPSDGDHKKAYATPALLTIGGKPHLVCPSAGDTIAYDPKTGDELWRLSHGGMNGSARPVMANGLVYLTTGHPAKLLAVKPDALQRRGQGRGRVAGGEGRAHPPVAAGRPGDLLFMVSDGGIASCLDGKSGKPHWSERLDGEFSASPVLAGGTCTSATRPVRRSW